MYVRMYARMYVGPHECTNARLLVRKYARLLVCKYACIIMSNFLYDVCA